MAQLWDLIEDVGFDSHFGKAQPPHWDTILTDENVLTEFKNQNKLLLNQYPRSIRTYPQVFAAMITYLTVMPTQQDSEQRKFKLPFVAGEILAINNTLIYEAFFGIPEDEDSGSEEGESGTVYNPQNLQRLLGYFANKDINPLLVGYIEKVYNNLFYGRKFNVNTHFPLIMNTLSNSTTDSEIKEHLLQHAQNVNVANMLRKIITLEKDSCKNIASPSNARTGLLEALLNRYPQQEEEFRENVCTILIEIFNRRLMIQDGAQFADRILNEYADRLFIPGSINSYKLLRVLLRKANFKQAARTTPEENGAQAEEEDTNLVLPESFKSKLETYLLQELKLVAQETAAPQLQDILNQTKKIVKPFGQLRMCFVDLVTQAIALKDIKITKSLAECRLSTTMLSLMENYRFNGSLHVAGVKIISGLLNNPEIRSQIVLGQKLVKSLTKCLNKPENELLYGHLTSIYKLLIDYAQEDLEIFMVLKANYKFYEQAIVPRIQKENFKWSGTLTTLSAGPRAFVDEEPEEILKKAETHGHHDHNQQEHVAQTKATDPVQDDMDNVWNQLASSKPKQELAAQFDAFANFAVSTTRSVSSNKSDFDDFDFS